MKKLPWLLAAAFLSGCSSDWSAGLDNTGSTTASAAQAEAAALAAAGLTTGSSAPAVRGPHSFANAPDLGSLVQYPVEPVVRKTGAYTWHAAELSEEHALRAAVSGNLRFTAPDGSIIDLAYERHVEHPDGNWSWIGRAPGAAGDDAVITFGPDAVFGTIPQGGQPPLRLTVADGRGWVVTADPRQLREIHNEATRPSAPDFFVPPKLAAAPSSVSGMQTAGAQAVAATSSSKALIDVLVGYTSGFAQHRGGTSAALTRIHNLVDITNEAYRNSAVNAEVRLVHSMEVSFPDATGNGDALEKVTGFRAPSTRLTPDPAFSALRTARDVYGADLVVVLRRFQDPENEGCGVAWLIGGGRRGISQNDEYFGYSVVSDGQDQGTDGKTYFCREETFAHELGHNMGSTHDRENAKNDDGVLSYGAYDYSFGQKTDSTSGDFYTVMAYGDSGQRSYRVFSNPNVTFCGGRACGVANQSDNARSLNQTTATVASFRASVVPVSGQRVGHDFNGDGVSDILWRNATTGDNTLWPSASTIGEQAVARVANLAWQVAGVGDFDGDGRSDLLWRNRSSGAGTIWRAATAGNEIAVATESNLDWKIAGVGDFNGDGRDDILWRNRGTGANRIWRSGDSGQLQGVTTRSNTDWIVAGVGDFNGDGVSDILWRNARNGANSIWPSASSASEVALIQVANLAWTVAGVGDFTGDDRADILWRNTSSGDNTIWPSGSTASEQAVPRVANRAWAVAGVGDYNGDGRADILWRNGSSGANTIWPSGGVANEQAVTQVANRAWRIVR